MKKTDSLIQQLSKNVEADDLVKRVNSIRAKVDQRKQGINISSEVANFDETWDTFEDSTEWDNSWDQG